MEISLNVIPMGSYESLNLNNFHHNNSQRCIELFVFDLIWNFRVLGPSNVNGIIFEFV